ncbi:MAG: PEGA domain-containing protein [Candidatus Coatesbacteria bacterium]|nr:MAG: PEGA domain-containing protein [Candidatus Coatesbacteria bacterium]
MEKAISLLLSVILALTSVLAIADETEIAEAPATVSIITEPSGAEVRVGSEVVGESPIKGLELTPGQHLIITTIAGFGQVEKTVSIKGGSNTLLRITIEEEKREGVFNSGDYWLGVGVGGIIIIVGVPLALLIALNTSDMG